MPAGSNEELALDGVLLGEWVVIVHCPPNLPDGVAATVVVEVERELAALAQRMTAALSVRYREHLDVRLDP